MSKYNKVKGLKPDIEISLDSTTLIKFIEDNSDMSWNETCDFTVKHGLYYEYDNREYLCVGGHYNKELQDYIDAFFDAYSEELNGVAEMTFIFTD